MKEYKLAFISVVMLLSLGIEASSKIGFFKNERDLLQTRIDLIQSAKQEILAQYFHATMDKFTIPSLGYLISKAQEGVKVKVIFDSYANQLPHSMLYLLAREENIEVKLYNTFGNALFRLDPFDYTRRMHDKALNVDGNYLVSGGRNFSAYYLDSYDREKDLRSSKSEGYVDIDFMAGGEVASRHREYFYGLWTSKFVSKVEYDCAPDSLYVLSSKDLCSASVASFQLDQLTKRVSLAIKKSEERGFITKRSDDEYEKVLAGKLKAVTKASFIYDPPGRPKGGEGIRATIQDFVTNNITSSLTIVSPYVVLTEGAKKTLKELRDNEVNVTIYTNSIVSADSESALAGFLYHLPWMLENGIKVYEYQSRKTLHAKAAIADGKYMLIGSYNLDPRSAYLNREIGIIVEDLSGELYQELEGQIHRKFRLKSKRTFSQQESLTAGTVEELNYIEARRYRVEEKLKWFESNGLLAETFMRQL